MIEENQQFQVLKSQLDQIQFGFKLKSENQQKLLDGQQKLLDGNTLKIQELEEKINQLQVTNEQKQQEIDTLMTGQKKLTNDLKKLWNLFSSITKTQKYDSQINSQLPLNLDQIQKQNINSQSFSQQDLFQSTKYLIQQEIQSRFLLIKDTFLKKSEFDNFCITVEEQIETLRSKWLPQPENQFKIRKDSYQQSTMSQFQIQPLPFKGDYQSMKQQLEKNEQLLILDTQLEEK